MNIYNIFGVLIDICFSNVLIENLSASRKEILILWLWISKRFDKRVNVLYLWTLLTYDLLRNVIWNKIFILGYLLTGTQIYCFRALCCEIQSLNSLALLGNFRVSSFVHVEESWVLTTQLTDLRIPIIFLMNFDRLFLTSSDRGNRKRLLLWWLRWSLFVEDNFIRQLFFLFDVLVVDVNELRIRIFFFNFARKLSNFYVIRRFFTALW